MMKPRSNRIMGEQTSAGRRDKSDSLANGSPAQRNQVIQSNSQQASAQAIRKRRSSINVYDQPSSLNSRLRQLETDMLRLDEDRTKLFDDTHSALAQYELKLSEIHAILKSRQDNVEKYVEDMRILLQAKEEFEKQAKLLNEKHDRIHEKFMHRETTISREIKLLKNKFESLEKSRQFKSILQKSNTASDNSNTNHNSDDSNSVEGSLKTSDANISELDSRDAKSARAGGNGRHSPAGLTNSKLQGSAKLRATKGSVKNVRIKLDSLNPFRRLMAPLFGLGRSRRALGRKSNRVSASSPPLDLGGGGGGGNSTSATAQLAADPPATVNAGAANQTESIGVGDTPTATGQPPAESASGDLAASSVAAGDEAAPAAAKTTGKTPSRPLKLFGRLFG